MIPEIYFKVTAVVFALLLFGIRRGFTSHFKFSKAMLIRVLVAVLIFALYFSSFVSFASMNVPESIRVIDGGLLMLIGLGGFYLSHRALGKNWTPIINPNTSGTNTTKVVKSGPYRYIRHPIYAAMFVTFLGFWVFVSNWILGGVPFFLGFCIYFSNIGREEKLLIDKFGKEYGNYMNRTWRLFPKLR